MILTDYDTVLCVIYIYIYVYIRISILLMILLMAWAGLKRHETSIQQVFNEVLFLLRLIRCATQGCDGCQHSFRAGPMRQPPMIGVMLRYSST